MTQLSNIINSYLLTDLSELSDADFDFFNKRYNLCYKDKYTCPTIKYNIVEDTCKIYFVGNDNREFSIGFYFKIKEELSIFVAFGFMSRQTINNIQSFNIPSRSEGVFLKNTLLLEQISEYFYNCDIFNLPKFKFNFQEKVYFKDFYIEHKNSFSIIDGKIKFNYNYLLHTISADSHTFAGSIHVPKFNKDLLKVFNIKTQTLFNKNFNRLTQKELMLLKMYNI